jgi:hypothetical protein
MAVHLTVVPAESGLCSVVYFGHIDTGGIGNVNFI